MPLKKILIKKILEKKSHHKQNNYAFIDSQNLYLAIRDLGWKIDYRRFRVYLKEKYSVQKTYMFIGYLAENQELYRFLQEAGFILIFKPILEKNGQPIKGNCDVDLALHAIINYNNYDQAIIITGDGDFYCLVKYLRENKKLAKVLAPSNGNCSVLLRKAAGSKLALVSDLRNKIEYKKREKPLRDKTLRGVSHRNYISSIANPKIMSRAFIHNP